MWCICSTGKTPARLDRNTTGPPGQSGVSLGTCSGAALSEAIKLAILRARWTDEDGEDHEYDDVVIEDRATSIAAGAFPFAFAPVVLKRKKYEYGDRLWPKRLEGLEEYPFSYVDGGTFNNEPIREAFRLASFIDAVDPGDDFDRRVVVVDPRVGSLTVPMRVPVHTEFFLQEPNTFGTLDGIDLRRRSTLDRLKDQAGTVLTAVLNESTTIEKDKVYHTIGPTTSVPSARTSSAAFVG